MTDHEKLSMETLDSDESQRKFALLILRLLSSAGASVGGIQNERR